MDLGRQGMQTNWQARCRPRDSLVLGALVLVITGLNLLWVSLETRPPHWDAAKHLGYSLQYRDLFAGGHFGTALTVDYLYPPLVYWTTDLFYGVVGSTALWVAVLSQAVFLGVLVFATYGIGRELWSRRVGLLSALVVVTTPMIASEFHDYLLEAPLTALVALALYLLIRSKGFADRRYSLLLGAACGLGLLVKWSFPVYLALPLLAGLVPAARLHSRERLVNLLGAAAVVLAIGGLWYVHNASQVVSAVRSNTTVASIHGAPPAHSLQSFLWPFWNLVTNQLYLIPFLLFAAGLLVLFRRQGALWTNLYPVLAVVGTCAVFALFPSKDPRYTLPMLPAVAVIATYWLDSLRPRARRWLSGGVAVYSAVTFVAVSFGIGFLPKEELLRLGSSPLVSGVHSFTPKGDVVLVHGLRIWAQHGYPAGPPSGEHWYQEQMFQEAARYSPTRTLWYEAPDLDFIWFNSSGMVYYGLKYHVTWVYSSPDQADFAGIRSPPGATLPAPSGFVEINQFALPDGGTLRLYSRF